MKNKHWIVAAALSVSLASGVLIKARAEDKEKEEGDEQKIKLTEAPAAVQEALKKESKGAKIETIDKEMRDGKQVFEADAIVDGKNHEIIVDADGKVVSNKLDEEEGEKGEKGEMKEKGEKGEKEEKDEVKVPLDQVPAAVKATFAKESGGAEVKEVEKESEKGKNAYETKVKIDGKEYEIKVAEDGTLLKKKLEEDEKEEHGKKEKEDDEKEEKGEKK